MVDFAKIMRKTMPQTYEDMQYHNKLVEDYSNMPDEFFLEQAQYIFRNSTPLWSKGKPVYDSVLFHVVIPELLKRLGAKEKKIENEVIIDFSDGKSIE